MKNKTFSCKIFIFLKKYTFLQELISMEGTKNCFCWDFILWVYPFFRKKEKISPLENFESNWNVFHEKHHFLYGFVTFISFFPDDNMTFVHDRAIFWNVFKRYNFSSKFSNCLEIELGLFFNFFYVFASCNNTNCPTKGEINEIFQRSTY